MVNNLTLAVAGSGKTRELVEHCAELRHDKRAAVVTFTRANQAELQSRVSRSAGDHPGICVMGWFTFLLRDFARPFIPFKFPSERVRGFNFEGRPNRYAKGKARFLDSSGAAYRCELGRLAHELIDASERTLLRRLECCYDEILIDEVQDLHGHDWEVLDRLLKSSLRVRMVGDIRQAVLSTNPRSPKNKQYADAKVIKWFREREAAGILDITEKATTYRCCPEIASFSDTIFDAGWGFPVTKSRNMKRTGHDGVYVVRRRDVSSYVLRYRPQCLRYSSSFGNDIDLEYFNFGEVKGLQYERVLIVPTAGISEFVRYGASLKSRTASRFYVAVTRAAQSVGIVLDDVEGCPLPIWEP